MLLAALPLALLACTSGSPSEQACTDMGCTDGLDLAFSLTQPGAWSVAAVVQPGDRATTCTGTLPFSGAEGCVGDGSVGLSGSALPADQQSVEGMFLPYTDAASVQTIISVDDAVLVSETYAPAYVTSAPNGVECGPVCEYDSIPVSW